MLKRLNVSFWILLGLLVVGCGSRLPTERPADAQFGYSFNGGMMIYGESISIAADGSSQRVLNHFGTIKVQFQLPDAELDALYETFRENKIDRITSSEEEVYDRGGDSVSISFSGERFRASDSSTNFVDDRWQDEFNQLVGAINRAAGSGTTTGGTDTFNIQLDPSMESLNSTIQIDMGAAFRGLLFDISTPELFQIKTSDGNGSFPLSILNNDLEVLASTEIDLSNSRHVLIENRDGVVLFTPSP